MPRTSTQTAAESRQKSTISAESASPRTTGTVAESPRFSPDPPDRVLSSVSKTATLAAPSPIPTHAPAGSYSQSPKASALPEKSLSHPAAEEETSPEIAQTHG